MEVPKALPPPSDTGRWKRVAKAGAADSLLGLVAVAVLAALNAYSPSPMIVLGAQAAAGILLVGGLVALVAGIAHFARNRPDLKWPVLFAILAAALVFGAHLYVINSPPTLQCSSPSKLGCAMDEVFYVPAAQAILSGEQCVPYADNCNLEHPFLAKALIASGIEVFGSNDLGWRIFNALLGSLSVSLLFVLVLMLTGNRRFSYFSSFLFAADTMFFVHSSIALIDVPAIFFTLFAFVLYFWKGRFWRLDNVMASGVLLGLALLSKETAVFAVATLFTYQLIFADGTAKHVFKETAKFVIPAALVFFAGLQAYDVLLAFAKLPTFIQHLEFIFKYGAGLTGGGWKDPILGRFITPFDWLVYYAPVSYLVTTVTVTVASGAASTTVSYVGVGYYGVNNVIVLWLVFAWIPVAIYSLRMKRAEGVPRSKDDQLILFVVTWFLWSYIPYIALWLYGRVTYPFYILPAVPALAVGAAYFITREWFPRRMVWVYLVATFAWFVWYFPLKDFLPVFVRAALGR